MNETTLGVALSCAFIIHLPFGFIRAKYERFSRPWARCLYTPILMTVMIRHISGVTYAFIPYFIIVAIIGQVSGKRAGLLFHLKRNA